MIKYRVFYSNDCLLYGVQKEVTDYRGTYWTQVLPPRKTQGARKGKSAYTIQRATAEKWLKQLQDKEN